LPYLKVSAYSEQVSFSATIPCLWKLVFKMTIKCSPQTLGFVTSLPVSFQSGTKVTNLSVFWIADLYCDVPNKCPRFVCECSVSF